MAFAKVFDDYEGNNLVMYLDQDAQGNYYFKVTAHLVNNLSAVTPGIYTSARLIDMSVFTSVEDIYHWIDVYGYLFATSAADYMLRELTAGCNPSEFKSNQPIG